MRTRRTSRLFANDAHNFNKPLERTKGLEKVIKKYDMFGQRINLTFHGENKYKTTYGGIVSILTIAVFVSLLVIKTIQLVGKQKPDITMYSGRTDFLQ